MPPPVHLLEREGELATIEELLDSASGGEGRVVLVEGPAGIGKTELLRATRSAASKRGMQTLSARGGELERELPFVVVRELLGPVVEGAAETERSELMAGAAGLARAVLGSSAGRGTSPAALASALHGLFWLCSNLADRRPLMLAVDDVHWADVASLRFVAYLAHRIGDLRALLVLGLRTGEPGVNETTIGAIRGEPTTTVLAPAPLGPDAVGELALRSYEAPVAREFAAACRSATGGNPFLVLELLAATRDEGLRPTARDADRVEAVRPPRVGAATAARLARLSTAARKLAPAIAVLGDEAEVRHAAALAELPSEEAEEAADALAAAELIEPRRPLTFRHPLIREAVYQQLPAGRRAIAHARAAALLAEGDAADEEVAVHLLHTEPARDDRVVEVLRGAAGTSVGRAAPQQAVSYLRRALAEPPGDELRAPLLRALGDAEMAAGDESATRHLSEALALSEGRDRAAIAAQLAVALDAAAKHEDVVALLRGEVDRIRPVDADIALRLEAAMLGSAWLSGRALPEAADLLERLAALPGETPGERALLAAGSWYLIFSEGSAAEVLGLARRSVAGGRLLAEQGVEGPLFWLAVGSVALCERYAEAVTHVDAAERVAARQGSVVGSALVHGMRAANSYLRGAVADAVEDARETMGRTIAANWQGGLPVAVGVLTLALREQGDLAAIDQMLPAELPDDLPPQQLYDVVLTVYGASRLDLGRPAEALGALRRAASRQEERGSATPVFFSEWRTPAARALWALGDRAGARQTAGEALDIARRWGTPASIASALRALAAVEEGQRRVARLREALALVEDSEAGLERMHVLVDLGAELRHARQPGEAREPLLMALEMAERGGAWGIAERAREELAATGVTRRRRTFETGVDALTPSERRVATLAAEGMGNPEIAQRLFVTRRTVETHLTHAYAKLGITGRNELGAALERIVEPPRR